MSTNKDFDDVFSEGAEPPKPSEADTLREQRLARESETTNEFTAEFLRDETQPAATDAATPAAGEAEKATTVAESATETK